MANAISESETQVPLNSILVDINQADFNVSQPAASPNAVSKQHSRSLPRIALDLLNLKSVPLQAGNNSSNGIVAAKRHRPVVRSQSSRVSLLRQPPPSASSLTSGPDTEHFPIPDQ